MKKASMAIALVLVSGLFAAAFSLVPAVAYTSDTGTSSAGDTESTATETTTASATTNATGEETFSASGSIAALIFDMGEVTTTSEVQDDTTGNATESLGDNMTSTMPQIIIGENETGSDNMTSTTMNETSTAADELELPYILSGDWSLDVQDGSVSDFAANFTMIHTDGTGRHTHDLSNFVSSNSTTIDTSGEGTSFIFGTVDVATDGEPKWTGVDALIIIEKNNVISISLATEDTEDHFGGQPIYGIVYSMTDEDGNELIDAGTSTTENIIERTEDVFNGTGQ